MYPGVTSDRVLCPVFLSISRQTHAFGSSQRQTINPDLGHRFTNIFDLTACKRNIFCCAERCSILQHRHTHAVSDSRVPALTHTSQERLWLNFTQGGVQNSCCHRAYPLICYFTICTGTPLVSPKKQISTRCSPSFWMNDLRSQLPGSLHQTWPTLIINYSGGQCPIFTAESSVMPGQTKPPEFHHFQLLLTQSNRKEAFICSVMAMGCFENWLKCIFYMSHIV